MALISGMDGRFHLIQSFHPNVWLSNPIKSDKKLSNSQLLIIIEYNTDTSGAVLSNLKALG
jgi:hypothetical protein